MKIEELILYSNNLGNQLEFYTQILGFEIEKKSLKSFSVRLGESLLTFIFKEDCKPYHFAFNISINKELEALNWLKQRVEILSLEDNEIIEFNNWNASSLYFYDTDNNIVEFISRKNLKEKCEDIFSSKSILNISEIGIGTQNIEIIYNQLNSLKNINIYDGNFNRFCALGNEEGLFILVNKNIKNWFPTNDKVYQSDFIIKGDYNFEFKNGKIIEIT